MCLTALPLVASIGSGLMSAAGSMYSGKLQSNQYKAERKMLEYQALSQREAGAFESARKGRENEMLTGSQITAVAQGGGDLSGSSVDLIAASRAEGEMDKALIRQGMEQRAQMSTYQSKIAKMNEKAAKSGSMLSAGAGLVNAFSNIDYSKAFG